MHVLWSFMSSKTYSQLFPDDMGDQTCDYVHSHSCPFHWHTVEIRDIQLPYSCGSCREAPGSQELLKTFVHIIHKYMSISRPSTTSDTTMILMQHLCLESVRVLNVCYCWLCFQLVKYNYQEITCSQGRFCRRRQLPGLIFALKKGF